MTLRRSVHPVYAIAAAGLLTTCGDIIGSGSEATPEDREEAQQMAIYLSGELAPPTWLTHRISVGLHAIRDKYGAEFDMLSDVRFKPPWVPSRILVAVTAETHAMILSGEYHEWDHLNQELRMMEWATHSQPGWFVLNFEGMKHPERLIEAYEGLPGVFVATYEEFGTEWPNVFPNLVLDELSFLFWEPWCPAPARICRTNDYVFVVWEGERLVLRGAWQPETDPFEPRWWPEANVNIERYFGGEP